ncbi:MAG: sterol desaturase family protein [Bacteroidetes bacterium]|nr:sterol desaturase family protein [Bacteroidota bacterium]
MPEPKKNIPRWIWIIGIALAIFVYHFWEQLVIAWNDPESLRAFISKRISNVLALLNFNWKHLFTDIYIVAAALTIETIWVGWENCSLKKLLHLKNKSLKTDLFFFALAITNSFKFLSVVLTFGIAYLAFGIVGDSLQMNFGSYIHWPWLQFIVVALYSELIAYWIHRFAHSVKWWWMVHRFHHSANEMGTLTYYRVHFIEDQLNTFFKVIPFIVFGMPLESYVIYYFITELHNLLIHSEIKSDWGWFGKYVLVSPMAHRIHHSVDAAHYNYNFSNFLTIWDRLMGTFKENAVVEKVGLTENPYNQKGIFSDLWTTYKDLMGAIFESKNSHR